MLLPPKTALRCPCPRCGGTLYPGYDRDAYCLLCGERIYLDASPAPWEALAVPSRKRRFRRRPGADAQAGPAARSVGRQSGSTLAHRRSTTSRSGV